MAVGDDKLRPPMALEPLPWLIYTHDLDGKKKQTQTFSTGPFNNKSYITSVPILQGKSILASQFDWLFLKDEQNVKPDTTSITLWNPFTSKAIILPPLVHQDNDGRPVTCLLVSNPSEERGNDDGNTFVVLLFFTGLVFSCRFHSSSKCYSSSDWVSHSVEIVGEKAYMISVVSLNGVIYGSPSVTGSPYYDFMRIDVAYDEPGSAVLRSSPSTLPNFVPDIFVTCWGYVLESCGIMYVARVATRKYKGACIVKIWEFDMEQGSWIEVKCLGDRAFFLGRDCSTWCWASRNSESFGSVQGNCVYISLPELVQDAVVLYSLNDRTTTFLSCPKLLLTCSEPFWAIPSHLRLAPFSCKQIIVKVIDVSESYQGSHAADCKVLPPENDMQATCLSDLPLHLIESTSKYMHLFDYWNFRCSSKIFQSSMAPPRWRTHNSIPLLMVFENDDGLCRVMDPCRDDVRSCTLKFSNKPFAIDYSKNGWLLIFDGESLKFYNPFTRVRGYLPVPNPMFYYEVIGFSTYPTCSECLTVSIEYDDEIVIRYLRFGGTTWKLCRFNNDINFHPASGCPVYYGGAFYFLDVVGYLGVYELVDGDPRWTVYEKPSLSTGRLHSCYLVECSGELVAVFVGDKGKWIQLFKFNHSNTTWTHLKSLGDHILFIHPSSSCSVVTSDTKMKNRIYLPCLRGKSIVYYSLETRKYHTRGTDDSFNDLCFVKHILICCWI